MQLPILRHVCCALAVFTVAIFGPGISEAVTIDDFSTAYPPNPDLPNAGYTLIFVGTMCDGSACPPGNLVSHPVSDAAYQTGVGGVLGGERLAQLYYVVGTANSSIIPSLGWMTMNHNAGASAILDLTYGGTVDLDADFVISSATKFIVNVASGDMYAGPRPVPCTITVTSGRGTAQEATASVTLNLVNEGDYDFPFASFSAVDFSDVDMISYRFDASAVTSVDFGIGPLMTDGLTVPTEETTWGELKSLFE